MPSIDQALEEFFSRQAPIARGQLLLVAFSGGPDSTALLASLGNFGLRHGFEVQAVHVDHGLDPGSTRRADAAQALSKRLRVPFHPLRLEGGPQTGESLEAAARRRRYRALENLRKKLGARYVATAHHRDDQAETVALRLAFGSGLSGLEGIRPVHGRVIRPLLEVPRKALLKELHRRRLSAIEDPTNRDLSRPRNLLRHRILPFLETSEPKLREGFAALAAASRRARQAWYSRLLLRLEPRPVEDGWGIPLEGLRELPQEVGSLALEMLHSLAGHPYPPTGAARRELYRHLNENGRIGVDCGAGLRWERRGKLLVVVSRATPTPFFSYTLQVPGEVRIAELGVIFRLCSVKKPEHTGLPGEPEGAGSPSGPLGVVQRALFNQVLTAGETVTIRNRRPGDRIDLSGARSSRPLKDLFAAHPIPFRARDRQVLVCAQGSIIWIPGFGVIDRFRPRRREPNWLAEISANEQ